MKYTEQELLEFTRWYNDNFSIMEKATQTIKMFLIDWIKLKAK